MYPLDLWFNYYLDYTCILILPIETDHLDRYVKILIAVTVMLFVLIQLEAMTVSAMMAMMELASTAQVCHNGFVIYRCVTVYLPKAVIHHVDVDECDRDLDECSINAQCTDTMGSYNCTCNIGYDGNGFNCTSL